MNLLLRFLWLLLRLPFVARRELFDESRIRLRVLPNDCDINFHLNNGRYLTFMDLGRVHLIAQAGFVRHLLRERLTPVMSAVEINFLRPLAPLQGFELISRILTWDEKYVYMEQRFESNGELYAIATARGLFLRRGRSVAVGEVLRTLGVTLSPPPMPAIVSHWRELTALKKEYAARR